MYVLFGMMVVGLGSWGVFAANNYLKPDGTPNFQELKSTKNGNKLTAEMWDNLMDGLSKMQQNWASNTTPWLEIPKGAVMAFNLETCPQWWSRFTEADGRFIMGSNSNIKGKGGHERINLSIDQLPSHKFYLFADQTTRDRWYDRPRANNYNHKNCTVAWENDHDKGDDNYSYTMAVSTQCQQPSVGVTNTLWGGESIDIQNPYIRLLYCQKN